MLYRRFNAPLVTRPGTRPDIEFLGMNAPEGTIPYLDDDQGSVSLLNSAVDNGALPAIRQMASRNDVGIYKEGGFLPGTYTVVYQFRFHPPVEFDEFLVHLNIMLMTDHPAYHRVRILVPVSSVREIYFTPSHLNVTQNNDTVVASGALAENEVLDFEVLLDKGILSKLPEFPSYTKDIASRVMDAYPGQVPFRPVL
jgi:hypothetical protein